MAFTDVLGTLIKQGGRVFTAEQRSERQFELQRKRLAVQRAMQERAAQRAASRRAQEIAESNVIRNGLLIGGFAVASVVIFAGARRILNRRKS